MMLEVGLRDGYAAALAAMPDRVRQALSSKANTLASDLRAKIQGKLAGTVLNERSGALAGSIVATIDEASSNISVRIVASGDVKYAAIHEFGGTIPPHQIVPDKAKALGSSLAASRHSPRARTCPR